MPHRQGKPITLKRTNQKAMHCYFLENEQVNQVKSNDWSPTQARKNNPKHN